MRFFFDFTRQNYSLNDYQGLEFHTFQSARDYANAITSQMQNSLRGEWIGWRVDVRNAEGMKFFSMPVKTARAAVICGDTWRGRAGGGG